MHEGEPWYPVDEHVRDGADRFADIIQHPHESIISPTAWVPDPLPCTKPGSEHWFVDHREVGDPRVALNERFHKRQVSILELGVGKSTFHRI